MSPIHLLIEHSLGGKLHMLSLVCVARVHVISAGPISTVQTEGQGSCSFIGQSGENDNSSYKL
ncbi:unnamed protein product [Staurois parvus]|uniref:Uncharacterized protein n=1 Tax=Staurois parvus TaxID=386267 RepID=A0ABN9BY78_9NEOB|nr:unnamed protein product [Staurois parvus]